jgi:hypothetical protein
MGRAGSSPAGSQPTPPGDAVTDERQYSDGMEAYIADGLEYLRRVAGPEEPDKYIVEPD